MKDQVSQLSQQKKELQLKLASNLTNSEKTDIQNKLRRIEDEFRILNMF